MMFNLIVKFWFFVNFESLKNFFSVQFFIYLFFYFSVALCHRIWKVLFPFSVNTMLIFLKWVNVAELFQFVYLPVLLSEKVNNLIFHWQLLLFSFLDVFFVWTLRHFSETFFLNPRQCLNFCPLLPLHQIEVIIFIYQLF